MKNFSISLVLLHLDFIVNVRKSVVPSRLWCRALLSHHHLVRRQIQQMFSKHEKQGGWYLVEKKYSGRKYLSENTQGGNTDPRWTLHPVLLLFLLDHLLLFWIILLKFPRLRPGDADHDDSFSNQYLAQTMRSWRWWRWWWMYFAKGRMHWLKEARLPISVNGTRMIFYILFSYQNNNDDAMILW